MNSESPVATPATLPARRRFFTLRTLGRAVIACVCLFTLVALFYVEEHIRGRAAFNHFKKELAAQGFELDFHKFIPAPVPDDQNFAMTPFLAPLFDYQTSNGIVIQRVRDTNAYQRIVQFGSNLVEFPSHEKASVTVNTTNADLPTFFARMVKRHHATNESLTLTSAAAAQKYLDLLKPCQPQIEEIRAAAKRPYARFNIAYLNPDPAAILLQHLAVMKKFSQISAHEAAACLQLNRPDEAATDLVVVPRLSDSIRAEPFLVSQLVKMAITQIYVDTIWQGLSRHQWSESQLALFQDQLEHEHPTADMAASLRGEFAFFGGHYFDFWRSQVRMSEQNDFDFPSLFIFPTGWTYFEQINYLKVAINKILVDFNPETALVSPRLVEQNNAYFSQPSSLFSKVFHHDILTHMSLISLTKIPLRTAVNETACRECLAACALERYRLAHSQLPATLAELTPAYLASTPIDVCNGQPLIYKKIDDQNFQLYSVGWNLTDDGGITARVGGSNKTLQETQGDWVWPEYPHN